MIFFKSNSLISNQIFFMKKKIVGRHKPLCNSAVLYYKYSYVAGRCDKTTWICSRVNHRVVWFYYRVEPWSIICPRRIRGPGVYEGLGGGGVRWENYCLPKKLNIKHSYDISSVSDSDSFARDPDPAWIWPKIFFCNFYFFQCWCNRILPYYTFLTNKNLS